MLYKIIQKGMYNFISVFILGLKKKKKVCLLIIILQIQSSSLLKIQPLIWIPLKCLYFNDI